MAKDRNVTLSKIIQIQDDLNFLNDKNQKFQVINHTNTNSISRSSFINSGGCASVLTQMTLSQLQKSVQPTLFLTKLQRLVAQSPEDQQMNEHYCKSIRMMEKTCKSYGYYVNSNNMYMIIILVVYFTDNLRGVQISNIF